MTQIELCWKDHLVINAIITLKITPRQKFQNFKEKSIIISTEGTKIPPLFDRLLKKREHISLVIDSAKNTIGIVTLEDIIETILGYEIVDETDMVDDMQVLAKKIASNEGKPVDPTTNDSE